MIITKIQNKNYQVNIPGNKITFLDSRGYMSEEGNFYPSVTTVLSAYPKSSGFFEWLKQNGDQADDILIEAGRKGSVIHELTERFDRGEPLALLNNEGHPDFKMIEWSCLEKYVEFKKRFPFEIEHCELNLVSDTYRLGGTLDRIIIMNGKRYLIDIKTSNAIYNHYYLQLAAYKKMFESNTGKHVDGVGILWLTAKTKTDGKTGTIQGKGYQLLLEENQNVIEKNWKLFQSVYTLWIEENGEIVPKNISYNLTFNQ